MTEVVLTFNSPRHSALPVQPRRLYRLNPTWLKAETLCREIFDSAISDSDRATCGVSFSFPLLPAACAFRLTNLASGCRALDLPPGCIVSPLI